MLLENIKAFSALAPVADAFAGTVVSDAIKMTNYDRVTFLILKGAGATGVSTITVEKCSAADGTGAEAIPFRFARLAPGGDTSGDVANVSATGVTTVAGADEMYAVELKAEHLLGATSKPFVRVKLTETVDSPVAGSIIALLHGAKFIGKTYPAAA